MTDAADPIPNELEALRAALVAERAARREAEARASGLDAMVAHLKLLVAKLRQDRFGASAERGAKLDQLELQLRSSRPPPARIKSPFPGSRAIGPSPCNVVRPDVLSRRTCRASVS